MIRCLGLLAVLCGTAPALAAGLESVPLACSGSGAARAGALLFVEGAFEGIRLDATPATTFVVYGENDQGMALVNPLEHGLEQKAPLADYTAVLQIGTANVDRMRSRQGFVAALLSGAPVGSAVEVLRCAIRP